MRGTDRCEEILRLIDESIGAPAAASAGGATPSCQPRRSRWALRTCDGGDRERLLADVGEFLAGSMAESL